MSSQELQDEVWKLVDEHALSLSQEDYLDFLQAISADADIRAEAVEQEMEDPDEDE